MHHCKINGKWCIYTLVDTLTTVNVNRCLIWEQLDQNYLFKKIYKNKIKNLIRKNNSFGIKEGNIL